MKWTNHHKTCSLVCDRRAKAAWEAYFETELARMKEEKPGLRLMQYKSMIFENWQRSPLNPRNQLPNAK